MNTSIIHQCSMYCILCHIGSADDLDDTPTGGYDEERPTSGYDDAPTGGYDEEKPTSGYDDAPAADETPTSTYGDAPPPPTIDPTAEDSKSDQVRNTTL